MWGEAGTEDRTERRKHPRHRASFQAEIDSTTIGSTRDISPAGVFLFAPGDFAAATGDRIRVRLRLDELDPARPAWIRGWGRIVRVEPRGASVGLAIRVEEWSVSGPADPAPR
jgi:hypothetical protein